MVEMFEKVQHPTIGEKYHCAWAKSRGMVWKLIAIEGDQVWLRTKYGKVLKTNLSDLREVNRNIRKKITVNQAINEAINKAKKS